MVRIFSSELVHRKKLENRTERNSGSSYLWSTNYRSSGPLSQRTLGPKNLRSEGIRVNALLSFVTWLREECTFKPKTSETAGLMILVQIAALARDDLELRRRHRRSSFGFNHGQPRRCNGQKRLGNALRTDAEAGSAAHARMCAKIYKPARDKYRETACSGEVLISRALAVHSTSSCSATLIRISWLAFVHLDSASDLDVLSFNAG